MYKLSKFIIKLEKDTSVILYSTFTTSIVELEKNVYTDIFDKGLLEKHREYVSELYELGFITDKDYDETAFMQELRERNMKANDAEAGYYIITPTTLCNARCYYCFENGSDKADMSIETAEAVSRYIINNHDPKNLTIQWFGGEPLLRPEIISLISNRLNAENIRFKSKIITNGYLLSNELIEKALNEWRVETVQITIDDIGEKYNKIKNYVYENTDAFSIVMNNILQALQSGLKIRVRINFNPKEYEHTIGIVKYLKDKFQDEPNLFMYLAPIDFASENIPSITGSFDNEAKHPLIALLDAEDEYCSFGNYDINEADNDDEISQILRKYYLTPIPTSCYGGCDDAVTIDAQGDIYVCHRLIGHKEYSSGNVFFGKLKNEIYKHYTNTKIESEECNNCNLLPICQGGCKYRAFAYGKDHACTMVKGASVQLLARVIKELE